MAKPAWLAEGPDLDLTAGIPDPPSPPSNALLQGMTDEQLQAIREQLEAYDAGVFEQDLLSLLAEVDFLRLILRDCQQESTAYLRGVQEERKRCLRILMESQGNLWDDVFVAIQGGSKPLEDFDAYREGRRMEREWCLALCEQYHQEWERRYKITSDPDYGGMAEGAQQIIEHIRPRPDSPCQCCSGAGHFKTCVETASQAEAPRRRRFAIRREPCPACAGTGSACAEAGQQEVER